VEPPILPFGLFSLLSYLLLAIAINIATVAAVSMLPLPQSPTLLPSSRLQLQQPLLPLLLPPPQLPFLPILQIFAAPAAAFC
jgi:hypothetical protein